MDTQDVLKEMREWLEKSRVVSTIDTARWADAIEAAIPPHAAMEVQRLEERVASAADGLLERDAKIERLERMCEYWRDKAKDQHALVEKLEEAVTRLLACPAIADEDHSDPEWGCAETREAEAFARAVLAPENRDA